MASYTMQLREYIEQVTQDEELPVRERIAKGKEKLFDFEYPLFDESYKNVFETNFIRNFYMREIGFEVEELFKFQLETWLLINMPYYNKLFESEMLQFDPLINSEMSITHNRTNDKTQNDSRDKLQNDERNKLQNDNRNITQNDTMNRLQNDNRDIIQNDTINTHEEGTKESDIVQDSNQTSNTVGKSDDKTNGKSSEESTKLFNGADAIDNFNRELNADTPDSRLYLTTEDGKGVIEYASGIKENVDKNKKVYDNRTRADGSGESETISTTNNEQDSTTNADATTNENVVSVNDEDTTKNSVIDDTLVSNINDTLVSKKDDTLISNVDDTLVSSVNDKLVSSINDIEDYVEHRVGKVGVSTYPEMIKQYRESFLRIEKQMFYEMNELFMLVY